MRPAAASAAALCLAIASLAGCGEQEEETFTASEMVAELNREGAGIELGDRLQSGSGDVRTFGLALAEPGEETSEGDAEGGHHHSGGSLAELTDAAAAQRELANCRRSAVASGAIYCFRAANVVIIIGDEISRFELQALADAVLALENG
jgi:hypothetical protein